MTGDPWGEVTKLIAACLVERPDLSERVELSDLAAGPHGAVVRVIRTHHAAGRPADLGALLANAEGPELAKIGGRDLLLYLDEGKHQVTSFDRYLGEVRRLAAEDAVRREAARPEGPDAGRLRAFADRLDGRGATNGKRRKLTRLDLMEMLNCLPPDVPWIAEPILVRGALTLLYGREGEGKSLIALALAIGVASGEGVAGFHPQAGKVVYVDAENGPGEIHRRVRALGLPDSAVERLIVESADSLDLRHDLGELEALIAQERPRLLVLDSFRALWGGSENDSDAVGPVMDSVRNLGRRHDTATLLLHHTGKVGVEYRGSTAIGAAVELAFILAREPEDEDGQRRFLACRKSRPAPEPGRRWLRLSTELGMTFVEETDPPDGQAEAAKGRPPRAVRELAPKVLASLDGDARSLSDVARACGRRPSDRTVRRVLEALIARGDVEHGEDGLYRCQIVGPPKGFDNLTTPREGGEVVPLFARRDDPDDPDGRPRDGGEVTP